VDCRVPTDGGRDPQPLEPPRDEPQHERARLWSGYTV
jgi:hypothetical protein